MSVKFEGCQRSSIFVQVVVYSREAGRRLKSPKNCLRKYFMNAPLIQNLFVIFVNMKNNCNCNDCNPLEFPEISVAIAMISTAVINIFFLCSRRIVELSMIYH